MTRVLLTVGNGLMGDDAAGVLLAQQLQASPLDGWQAIHGGAMPENVLHRVRELAPEAVLVVDAADMDLPPGSVRWIPAEKLDDPFLLTTHSLPLSYLVEALREFVPQVRLLGIQPEVVAFGFPVSASVQAAVDEVCARLKTGDLNWELLEVESELSDADQRGGRG